MIRFLTNNLIEISIKDALSIAQSELLRVNIAEAAAHEFRRKLEEMTICYEVMKKAYSRALAGFAGARRLRSSDHRLARIEIEALRNDRSNFQSMYESAERSVNALIAQRDVLRDELLRLQRLCLAHGVQGVASDVPTWDEPGELNEG